MPPANDPVGREREAQAGALRSGPRTPRHVVVVGAGIIGLVTALELCRAGHRVSLWTRDDPLTTTSAVAGAVWYPFLAQPRDRVLHWSAVSYRRLGELARDRATGVTLREAVELFADESPDLWWRSAVSEVQQIADDELLARLGDWGAAAAGASPRSAVRVTVPVCSPPKLLAWLVQQLARGGVDWERRELTSLDPALAAAEVVVNCSGLGARELCGDRELRGVRGQVLRFGEVLHERVWIDDRDARPFYMIPRDGDLIVGGSADFDREDLEPCALDSAAIQAAAVRVAPRLRGVPPASVGVGLRPYRPSVRLEEESCIHGVRLIHNYGHGGCGYTVAWGCAEEVVERIG